MVSLIFTMILTLGFVITMIYWWFPNAEASLGRGELIERCYPYINSTGDITYSFGKCYIPVYHHYETDKVCTGGILGIGQSCYESERTHYESFKTYKCIVAKTGEKC